MLTYHARFRQLTDTVVEVDSCYRMKGRVGSLAGCDILGLGSKTFPRPGVSRDLCIRGRRMLRSSRAECALMLECRSLGDLGNTYALFKRELRACNVVSSKV